MSKINDTYPRKCKNGPGEWRVIDSGNEYFFKGEDAELRADNKMADILWLNELWHRFCFPPQPVTKKRTAMEMFLYG